MQYILVLNLLELWLIIEEEVIGPINPIDVGIEEVMCECDAVEELRMCGG